MSESNVIAFLRELGQRPETLNELKASAKEDVLSAADVLGFPFSDDDFNSTIWRFEERLAATRGEQFSESFALWRLLWGKYYLEFLVNDLVPSLTETEIIDGA
jgi:nitrogen fixation uncharacterized protein